MTGAAIARPARMVSAGKKTEDRLEKLRERGETLVSKINQKLIFGVAFLSDIERAADDNQCAFLRVTMSISYAEELMRGFETEVTYLLKYGSSDPITCYQDYSALKDYECPDENVKNMYQNLFRRLKPVFEELDVEFDIVRGCRIIVPHTRRVGTELRKFTSKLDLGFGGYTLTMRPCLSCLAKALSLLDLLYEDK